MDEWNLQIDILDVGLGDCSFICAWNDYDNIFKSVLIDTGVKLATENKQTKCFSKDIFSHIQKKISKKSKEHKKDKLDTILITHFDEKHHGGIIDLLLSDNVSMLCLFIAETVSHYLSKKEIIKFSEDQKVYYASAIIYLILGGVFDHPDKDAYKYAKILEEIAKEDIFALNDSDVVKEDLPKKIKKGIEIAECVLEKNKKEFVEDAKACVLIPELKRTLYTELIISTIISLFKDKNKEEEEEEERKEKLINLIVPAIINLINDTANLSPNPIIVTEGAISTTTIMDVDDKKNMPKGYEDAINGKLNLDETIINVPGIKRVRKTNPDLGSELLECNNGNNEAPELFIIARAGEIWNGRDKPIEIKKEDDKESNPHLSIAVLACFNDFQYYSGANLSYKADYAISKVIMNENKIRHLKGREHYSPKCIAAFKCGNYGTNTHVTIEEIDGEKSFLSRIKAKAAIISCGWYDDEHPSEKLIKELFLADSEPVYYLTGCKGDIDNVLKDTYMGVPRRSRVSGLPSENIPGNITIKIQGSDLKNYDKKSDIRGKFSITYYESTFFNEGEGSKFRLGYINEEISF